MADTTYYYYTCLTEAGPMTLLPHERGYQLLLAHERLGVYATLQDAFIAAVTGKTEIPFSGGDLTTLSIPGDLSQWIKKVFAVIKRMRAV